MGKQLFIGAVLFGMLTCSWMGISVAQEAASQEVEEFAYGKVVSISSNNIVVNEYDDDTESDVPVTYVINAETKFENVNSYAEFKIGDDVEIDYKATGGKKVATIISKEVPWNLEGHLDFDEIQEERPNEQ